MRSRFAILLPLLTIMIFSLYPSYRAECDPKDKKQTKKSKETTKGKDDESSENKKDILTGQGEKATIFPEIPTDETMSGTVEWRINLKDDNGNVELPARYRTWWYIRLDGINPERKSTLSIIGDGFPGKSVVIPVYSYDNKNWHRMTPDDIINDKGDNGSYNYSIVKQFDSSVVWIARYYPYTAGRLFNLIRKYEDNPFLKIEKIGESRKGNPIVMLTITDPTVPDSGKKRVWIHARTHPSETGSSFVAEGLIELLLGDCNRYCHKADLRKLIFNIVPMLNIDGVIDGNARVSPENSYDLERMWIRRKDNPYYLTDTIPPEIKAIHGAIVKLDQEGPRFIAALNLHSKNAGPDTRPFLYTNFKAKNKEYGDEGDSLFFKQISLVKLISDEYCGDTIRIIPGFEIAQQMDEKLFPESWWWTNFKDSVLAATIETTSGRNGCFEEWVTFEDHKKLGEAIAGAIQRYYNYFIAKQWFRYEAPETDMDELIKYYHKNGAEK